MSNPYNPTPFFFRTLEPVHVGAGGYRLGRVDKTIVREPGTNLPKIPGTSLAGAARSYASILYGKPEAAGAHSNFRGDKAQCPIIYTFGTLSETEGGHAGTVSVGDARIVFFPVRSIAGCVHVTCPQALKDANIAGAPSTEPDMTKIFYAGHKREDPGLNLSWLWFDQSRVTPWDIPEGSLKTRFGTRLALVSDSLFSHIVNSNLEIRTSVAIDHETGTAKDHMLFSYEAIPRDTWLMNEVVEDDYRDGPGFKEVEYQFDPTSKPKEEKRSTTKMTCPKWTCPTDVVKAGLGLMEFLGVGGMGTRGFGRLKLETL